MIKITFMGAGSTVFARNVLGDCMCVDVLKGMDIALYDIDEKRLMESEAILNAMNRGLGNPATIRTYLGVDNRKAALDKADFVVNAIQVGLYDPCTITDFEVPKKYGLRQTIADTLGIGGIMRALRTIPVLADFAHDMEEVCPDAWFINYTNPMSMLSGFMQRYTGVKTIGLCHSVQVCSEGLLKKLDMEDKLALSSSRASTTWAGCWRSGTRTATTCIRRSAAAPRKRTPTKSTTTWCALTTSTSSATTAPNPASTTPSTTCST